MSIKMLPALLIIVIGFQSVFAGTSAENEAALEAVSFEKALKNAISNPVTPFGFSAHCRNDQGARAVQLYSSGIAVWDRKLQIHGGAELRHALLEDLLSSGFSAFAPRYGGKSESGRSGGPIRVSCRVEVTVDGLSKESVQLADGEQSQALQGLAASLLDRFEMLAPGGIGADSLEDGLRKIAAGALAPETLAIRLVQLPEKNSEADGNIVRVDGARWSWRDYQPGKTGPEAGWNPLPPDFAPEFAQVATTAQFWSIPINVPGVGHGEIEVKVLDHHKTVISRTFTRIEPGTLTSEKSRYDAVVDAVRRLRQ